MNRLLKRAVNRDPWPFPGHPRVLIEHPDPEEALVLATTLRRAGCTITICRGPAGGDSRTRCPLHDLGPCVIVEGADVVVTALDFAEREPREVLRGLRTRYPQTPLVVATTVTDALELERELDGCTVVAAGTKPDRIVAAVLAVAPPLVR